MSNKPAAIALGAAFFIAFLLAFFSSFAIALLPVWGALVYAIYQDKRSTSARISPVTAFMALDLIWLAVLSPHISQSQYMSWQTGMILGALPLAYLTWKFTAPFDHIWRTLQIAYFPLAWALAFTGLFQVYSGAQPRALGWGVDPNVYAAVLNLLWFPLFAHILGQRGQGKPSSKLAYLLQLTTLFFLSLAFCAATSRGALLSWLAAFAASFWIFWRYPKRNSSFLVIIAIAVCAYLLIDVSAHVQTLGRLEQADSGSDASVNLRFVLWGTTLKMFLAHPLLGTGLGTWHAIYPAYRPDADNSTYGYFAHNDYLQILQETGLIGAAIFTTVLCYMAYLAVRIFLLARHRPPSAETAGLALGVMTACLQANVNFIFYLVYISLLLGLYLGRMASVFEIDREQQPNRFNGHQPRLVRVLLVFVLFVPIGQLLINFATETLLNGNSSAMALLEKAFPSWGRYQTASLITTLRPTEYIAERYLAESQANALEKNPDLPRRVQAALLNDTVGKYERLREQMINPPPLCEEEVDLLLRFKNLLSNQHAASLARKVVSQCLQTNPRDPRNYIALAKLEALENGPQAAAAALSQGDKKMLFYRDSLILKAEWLKYQLPDDKRSLEKIQARLFSIKSGCPLGECTDNTHLTDELAKQLRSSR